VRSRSNDDVLIKSSFRTFDREMMLNRERQASNARASPPPTYRFRNAGTLLRFVWKFFNVRELFVFKCL
jgi:hypothetical protein